MSDISDISETGNIAAATGSGDHLSTAKQDVLELINQGYVCAPDDGPVWRAACEAGVDMSLVEDALRLSPAARLHEHQRALNQVLAMIQARTSHDSGS